MATKYIEAVGTVAGDAATELARLKVESAGNVFPIIFDAVDGALKYYDRVNAVVRQVVPVGSKPIATAVALTVTEALHAGRNVLLGVAAGSTVQLPLATGSGATYRFTVSVALTSNNWILSAVVATDVFAGVIFINDSGGSAAATADGWPTAATSNTLTMALATGGGSIGDYVEFVDILTGVWAVRGFFQGAADPVSPFSHV